MKNRADAIGDAANSNARPPVEAQTPYGANAWATKADGSLDTAAIDKRIAHYARIGMEDPTRLNVAQLRQVCFALHLHYSLLGIV